MNAPVSVKHLIIGAGPTGLGAAIALREAGENDFLVLEKEGKAGGLASSFVDSMGFTWDIGGHVQFSHYPTFDDMMNRVFAPGGWLEHKRSAWAWMLRRFVPYPVQNNLRYLPREQVWECVKGIMALQNKKTPVPQNFHEWITATFGAGLSELFMLPYNFKVWAHPPQDMAYQWIGERVAVTDLEKTLKNLLLESDDAAWGPNSMFRFPQQGGTGHIWVRVSEIAGHENFRFNADVREIDHTAKEVRCSDGTAYRYQNLISTMPLDVLCRMVKGLKPEITATAQGLRHSSSNIVGLGLKGQCPETLRHKSWIYFPESDCPFYRATIFSNYSPHNTPDPARYWSLMTETSESEKKPVNQSTLVEETIQGCLNTGLVASRGDIASTWTYRAPYGYPVPSLQRDAILDAVIPALDALGIYSRGRFGGWKYEVSNQDHSYMQGVELVRHLLKGEPETTYTVRRGGKA
jgi:protoporphyrinogen oxidase